MTSTQSALSTTTVAATSSAVIVTLLISRYVKRRFSPDISCHLKCHCGSVQGQIVAKWEDSIQINCYCHDCRQFAKFVASGKSSEEDEHIGCNHAQVVQVCKSALTITKGHEHIQLARKSSPDESKSSGQLYMHRYFAKCCHVPLYNTVDFLGFVGVFRDVLSPSSEVARYDGPVCMFPEEALVGTVTKGGKVFVLDFIWKLIRYHPWRKSGPFDYGQAPVFWGDFSSCVKKQQ